MSQQRFERFIEHVEAEYEHTLEQGSEQELFVASYLNGHFDLKVAEALNAQDYSLDNLNQAMQSSLDAAFAEKELEDRDAQQVAERWQRLTQFDN
ncbi:hypothetical protein HMF8227_01962 [Saliniradius amylolyticus]|uniref:YfcL protein n=1 Tax=Saliniradius amylolyticus TaxID=2183582 RepID=A0A2S2E4J3_9ALTE|nr:YfcL family protein [Saliniradius amylolyticus]AWL12432.1 hypothetical protein HMF8227_01962 [Saliniradius amylolyticus]